MTINGRNKVFSPATLGDLKLRNRLIRTAAFEGMCPNGVPTDQLVEHHRSMAAGGVGMTTVAYASVSADGRTYGHQILMSEQVLAPLRKLTEAVHAQGAAASIQLGHCGYFASMSATGERPIGASRLLNLYGLTFSRAMTDADIVRVTEDFGRGARLAREAGFDAVEIHAGHGYLLSQFLSPYTNRRKDAYGGSLENRLRFPIAALRKVRETLGPGFPILVKMNMRDGFSGGLEIDEAVEIAKRFEAEGASALVLSGGFVSKTPLYMLRGDVPTREMASVQSAWYRRIGLLLFGNLFVQKYPYKELFFLEDARRIRAAVKLPLVLVGGIRSVENLETAMAEGFDFAAMGRALIMEPDLPKRWARGETAESKCEPCNICIAEMDRGGVRCVK